MRTSLPLSVLLFLALPLAGCVDPQEGHSAAAVDPPEGHLATLVVYPHETAVYTLDDVIRVSPLRFKIEAVEGHLTAQVALDATPLGVATTTTLLRNATVLGVTRYDYSFAEMRTESAVSPGLSSFPYGAAAVMPTPMLSSFWFPHEASMAEEGPPSPFLHSLGNLVGPQFALLVHPEPEGTAPWGEATVDWTRDLQSSRLHLTAPCQRFCITRADWEANLTVGDRGILPASAEVGYRQHGMIPWKATWRRVDHAVQGDPLTVQVHAPQPTVRDAIAPSPSAPPTCGLAPCVGDGWRFRYKETLDWLETQPQWAAWSQGKTPVLKYLLDGQQTPEPEVVAAGNPVGPGTTYIMYEFADLRGEADHLFVVKNLNVTGVAIVHVLDSENDFQPDPSLHADPLPSHLLTPSSLRGELTRLMPFVQRPQWSFAYAAGYSEGDGDARRSQQYTVELSDGDPNYGSFADEPRFVATADVNAMSGQLVFFSRQPLNLV